MPIKARIRTIPDYPKAGIQFRDITTLLQDPVGFRLTIEGLCKPYAGGRIDKVAGIEARGFIVGGAVAQQLDAGFVPVRKSGKLPWQTIGQDYELEYGVDRVEVHTDAILEGISSLKERETSLPFEFNHSGGHALNEYLKILTATDISIDQCKSMGYGMNGLFSMALGKVVCAGNEPEHQKALGLPPSPVVNLPFDSAAIADILEDLLNRPKQQLEEIGRANRAYVEQYHEATIVAQRHLDFAESLG